MFPGVEATIVLAVVESSDSVEAAIATLLHLCGGDPSAQVDNASPLPTQPTSGVSRLCVLASPSLLSRYQSPLSLTAKPTWQVDTHVMACLWHGHGQLRTKSKGGPLVSPHLASWPPS